MGKNPSQVVDIAAMSGLGMCSGAITSSIIQLHEQKIAANEILRRYIPLGAAMAYLLFSSLNSLLEESIWLQSKIPWTISNPAWQQTLPWALSIPMVVGVIATIRWFPALEVMLPIVRQHKREQKEDIDI